MAAKSEQKSVLYFMLVFTFRLLYALHQSTRFEAIGFAVCEIDSQVIFLSLYPLRIECGTAAVAAVFVRFLCRRVCCGDALLFFIAHTFCRIQR